MRVFVLFLLYYMPYCLNAQDNLFNLLSKDKSPVYASYLFKGTKIVNGQSVKLQAKDILQFNIQHRFGPLNSGAYNLYGLDFSQVRLSLEYGLYDWLTVGIGRSSSTKVIDANSKFRLKRQIVNGFPVSIVINSVICLKQIPSSNLLNSNSDGVYDNLSYTHQILFARKITRNLSLQFTPTFIHYNLVEIQNKNNDRFSLGFGGRQKLTKRISLNTEFFYQLNEIINKNVLSLGFDIETGGHVFQLHLSNSPHMIDTDFITNTVGDFLKGDIFFGFNISRVFSLN